MMTTMTLTDFPLARIAEDEVGAQAASADGGPTWVRETQWYGGESGEVYAHPSTNDPHEQNIVVYDQGRPTAGQADHIARHDPARVLAECEAKRRIVEWCGGREMIWVGTMSDDPLDPKPEQFVPGPLKNPADSVVLRALASVYADHPDYQPEWAL